MPIKSLFLLISMLFLAENLAAKEYQWSNKLTFLGFLKQHNIPQKTYYNMDQDDKELIQEIRSGQSYTIEKKNNKITTIKIPVSDELMLQLNNTKNGYVAKYLPIPYEIIEKTISIQIKNSLKKDLYNATKSWYYGKELEEVYSNALPLQKMKKGDKVIIFYTQRYRNGKVFSSPQIEACLIEINKKPFYGFLMEDEKYYDSLGTKYKRTYHTKFIRPVQNFKRISSGFTHRRFHPILKRYKAHLGIDYAARTGRAIVASSAGKIVHKGWKGGYGRTVIIQHSNGLKTLYAHMRGYAKNIHRGQNIPQGKVIGYVGTSGRSTGPHLHFGLYKNGKPVNPARYVAKQSSKIIKLKGKKYNKLRKMVLKYRPQFKESKSRTIIKEESKECLNCLKKGA
ncbi:peptidoglycan DD-metalloendopeptidase family protein [bacterium]|nr:peptidoglycan DD-metalloendopeptidase family protein [bacterium]MBU1957877.1 peptidoglycan DD-metalloendopeptidase family protein [bacterium]